MKLYRLVRNQEMQDIVYYSLKFGLLGQILHDMVIGIKLAEIFDYRRTTLEAITGNRR